MFATAYLTAASLLLLAGCSLRGASKVAATPPPPKPAVLPKPEASAANALAEPFSVPQTRVQLPSPQPLDPQALAAAPEPAPLPPPVHVRIRAPLRNPPIAQPVPVPPPPENTAAEERPRILPLVPADEARRIQAAIDVRKREIHDRLSQVEGRRDASAANAAERIQSIHSFMNLSDEAARRGDMSQADALSERALVLARELPIAK